jgi:uncharacterized membrane protein YoaK (UPF0700 family)
VLSFIAGIINVVGLLGFGHQAITHLTGTTSLLGAAIADGDPRGAVHFGVMILAFVLGCALSGFIVQDSALKLGRRYGVALLIESCLLFAAVHLLGHRSALGMYAAATACGLQNALVSTYSGSVVRTTHVSGMFTDLGISLGHVLRGLAVDARRLRLCVLVISGFLCGGVVGAMVFRAIGYAALLVPATLTAAAALSYVVYRSRHARARKAGP